MKTKWIAMLALTAMIVAGNIRADDPNPDVAKAIQEIAARRAEKVEARVKQVTSWARGEAQELGFRGGFSADAAMIPAPGQTTRLKRIEKK